MFQDLGRDLLGPDVRLYWDQAVYKKPGTEAPFPWHQDNGYNFVEPQCYLTCWIALTDATEQSGCPWVVPGLHRLGTLEHWSTPLGYRCLEENPPGAVPIEAPAGSIVVFTSLTPHATGANRTAGARKAYIVQLALDGTCQTRPNAGDRRDRDAAAERSGSPVPDHRVRRACSECRIHDLSTPPRSTRPDRWTRRRSCWCTAPWCRARSGCRSSAACRAPIA